MYGFGCSVWVRVRNGASGIFLKNERSAQKAHAARSGVDKAAPGKSAESCESVD